MGNNGAMSELPVIDIAPLLGEDEDGKAAVAAAIGAACRDNGFFYVTGHGVPAELIAGLDAASRRFFALPEPVKNEIAMDRGGVGEHTDYGLLTLLLQDANGGLQVRTRDGWIEAPPLEGTFVCNIGDMLDKLTGGQYRSTPHRVRNRSGNERLSFPFFFDPGWDSEVPPLPYAPGHRWDGQVDFTGTYGEYLLSKVSKVFPRLFETLDERPR